MRDVKMKS